jgi:hypothetical protein
MGDDLGLLAARPLRGSWRPVPEPAALTAAELERIATHLLRTAASPLAYRTLKDVPGLAGRPDLERLKDGWHLHLVQAGLHERQLARVLDAVAPTGAEVLLVKGWTLAERYPGRGLRPYGDVDLVVRPQDHDRVRAALDARPVDRDFITVDLFHRFVEADGGRLDELFARSEVRHLGDRPVRVLGAADELRLVCLHYLRAGGWRALNLCDIAVLIETRPAGLDWEVVLPPGPRAQWVGIAARLAERIVGADLSGTPLAGAPLPGWIVDHVEGGLHRLPGEMPDPLAGGPRALARAIGQRFPPDFLELVLHFGRPARARRPWDLALRDAAERVVGRLTPLEVGRVVEERDA